MHASFESLNRDAPYWTATFDECRLRGAAFISGQPKPNDPHGNPASPKPTVEWDQMMHRMRYFPANLKASLRRHGITKKGQLTALLVTYIVIVTIFYVGAAVTLTKLVENRGVSDDICYLRQAYLFRHQGFVRGLNTDSGDARYLSRKYRELNFDPRLTPFINCEVQARYSENVVFQYPFGTGFLLSFFPPFAQASWLYVASATLLFMLVCGALLTSQSVSALAATAVVGAGNVYMMVNPAKSSYSIAPTMPICIVLGFVTVWMYAADRARRRVMAAAVAGFAVGLATDLRLSSALLAFGYAAIFGVQLLLRRNRDNFLRPAVFGLSCLIALVPLFASNVINMGSPFATAYHGPDTTLPDLSPSSLLTMLKWYGLHTHGLLLWIAVGLLAAFIVNRRQLELNHVRSIIGILVCNLIFNMGYFLTHPIKSQYYTIPPTMLTIWTIVFALHASEWKRAQRREGASQLPSRSARLWCAIAVVFGIAIFITSFIGPTLARKSPRGPTTISLEPNALVWTSGVKWRNLVARALEIYWNRHAIVNFDTASAKTVDALIASIAKDGRPQYFVIDSAAMREIVHRASAFGRVQSAGKLFGVTADRLGAVH